MRLSPRDGAAPCAARFRLSPSKGTVCFSSKCPTILSTLSATRVFSFGVSCPAMMGRACRAGRSTCGRVMRQRMAPNDLARAAEALGSKASAPPIHNRCVLTPSARFCRILANARRLDPAALVERDPKSSSRASLSRAAPPRRFASAQAAARLSPSQPNDRCNPTAWRPPRTDRGTCRSSVPRHLQRPTRR